MCVKVASSRVRASRVVSKALFVSLLTGTLVACSNDFSRITEQDYTSAVASQRAFLRQPVRQPMPAKPMRSAARAPVVQQQLSPVQVAQTYPAVQQYPQQQFAPVQQYPQVQQNQQIAVNAPYRPTPSNLANGSYRPAVVAADPIVTAAVGNGESGWTRVGGTTITVAPGESLGSISRRYGVPEKAILDANGLSGPNDIVAGRYVTIPTYVYGNGQRASAPAAQPQLQPFPQVAATAARPAAAQPAPVQPVATQVAPVQQAVVQPSVRQVVAQPAIVKQATFAPRPTAKPAVRNTRTQAPARSAAPTQQPAQRAPATAVSGGSYRVSQGDTLYSIARKHGVNVGSLSAANDLGQSTNIKIGQMLVIPGQGNVVATTRTAAQNAQPQNRVAVAAPVAPVQKQAEPKAQPAAFTPQKAEKPKQAQPKQSGNLAFRWPVKGRVISTFGDKTNGERNDGINLAVPDGTAIKAAEDGVVIYSGNELKSYGNLVLVRHSNGWVTAYAHNKALNVSRGDKVRRGQQIAKAGATGSVSSPQLRFELRKGSTPVNPLDHLGGV
ncbi:MAG: peptidoglycan DD-metalloendopeptidase family protein [Hyphomicrobiales bacterium]